MESVQGQYLHCLVKKKSGHFLLFENAATLLGTPVQCNTIQHNCSDIKLDFYDAYSCLSSSC